DAPRHHALVRSGAGPAVAGGYGHAGWCRARARGPRDRANRGGMDRPGHGRTSGNRRTPGQWATARQTRELRAHASSHQRRTLASTGEWRATTLAAGAEETRLGYHVLHGSQSSKTTGAPPVIVGRHR